MLFKYLLSVLRPENTERASRIKLYLAMTYAFCGWNACFYLFYKLYIKHLPSDPDERTKVLIDKWSDGKQVTYINIQGLSSIKTEVITPDVDKEEIKAT